MKSALCWPALALAGVLVLSGCGNTDPIPPEEIQGFQTLKVIPVRATTHSRSWTGSARPRSGPRPSLSS